MANFYKLLGISSDATADEIKKAYKRMTVFHPDKQPDHEAQANHIFQQLTEARDTLLDPARRLEHDYQTGVKKRPEPVTPTPPEDLLRKMKFSTGQVFAAVAVLLALGFVIGMAVSAGGKGGKMLSA